MIQAQGADANDWVFVHDAARPLITQYELHGLVDAIESSNCPGVVLVFQQPIRSNGWIRSVRVSEESDSCIADTVDRTGLWHAMTPQVFRLGQLSDALQAAKQSGLVVTDESQAMEANGRLPWLIRGRRPISN